MAAVRNAAVVLAPLLAVTLTLLLAMPASGAAQRPEEYQVKAAYLHSFGRFVEWPPTAGTAFAICVIGLDPFGRALDDVVAGATIHDRPVNVIRVTEAHDAASCQIAFVAASENARLDAVLGALQDSPVLTVGEAPDFVQRGGMIGFAFDGNRVRFAINLAAAQDAGLMVSSELLRVAVAIVRERR
jgi:hypothetical protein